MPENSFGAIDGHRSSVPGRPMGAALAVLSAGLLFVAGEPLGAGIVAWVALVPLFAAVRLAAREAGAGRWAFSYGLLFGLVFFGIHLWWIFLFGWMAWTALVFVLSLYTGLATFVGSRVSGGRFAPLLVAGAWTGAELLRDRWPYGGYSWGAVGTTQTTVPGVRFLAGTIGVYGLSFLIAFAGAGIVRIVVDRDVPWRSVAAVGGVLLAFVVADLAVGSSPTPIRPLRVGVVQGNVPRPIVVGQRNAILKNHIDLTRQLLATHRDLDLVVWPEESIGEGVSPGSLSLVEDFSRDARVPMLVGQTIVEDGDFLNLVRHIDARGRLVETYQKRHPVPFGEYVPVGFMRRFVGTLESEIPTDQVPGTRANVFDVNRTAIATPICFESVFPRDFLDFVRNGAELFVLSTNDSSFERSYASQQHLAHTRMRALETRQWVIQAALSGPSAVIEPDGDVLHETRLFEGDAFVADVRARPSPSLYAKTGDLFASLFATATGIVYVAALRPRRRPSAEMPSEGILAT